MKITTIMFDLDGTLLPMDNDEFTKSYFSLITQAMTPHGYEPETLVKAIMTGITAMVKNDGTQSNEGAFWRDFSKIYGEKVFDDKPLFDEFYKTAFQNAKAACGCDPKAAAAVRKLKESGLRIVLATNPIFPRYAVESRIRWAGLSPEDFEFITSYENIGFCKPNSEYYREILRKLDLSPEECVMAGNDVTEDMIAQAVGMKVFLLTKCLINKENKDISVYPHGGFEELLEYVAELVKDN